MDRILDRKVERAYVHQYLDAKKSDYGLFFITGASGCGKTTFLRYIVEEYNSHVVSFSDGTKIYRCKPGANQSEYELVGSIIQKASLENPEIFSGALDACSRIPTLPALWKIIYSAAISAPIVKHIASTATSAVDQAAEIENALRSVATPQHVQDAVSEILDAYFLRQGQGKSFIIIAIDDITWVDEPSLRILMICIKRLASKGIRVYVFASVQIHPDHEQSIRYIQDLVDDYLFGYVNEIKLENLDVEKISEVFEEANKQFPVELYQYFYDITSGNFEELGKILRKSKSAIRTLYDNKVKSSAFNNKGSNDNSNLYYESVSIVLDSGPVYPVIYLILYESGGSCELSWLKKIAIKTFEAFQSVPLSTIQFKSHLTFLESEDELFIQAGIVVCHSKRLDVAIQRIKAMGIYSKLVKSVASALTTDTDWLNNLPLALKLLGKIDPEEALKLYITAAKKHEKFIFRREVFVEAGKVICDLDSLQVQKNVKFIESIVFGLCKFGCFDFASKIGDVLDRSEVVISGFEFHYNLFKARRESGTFSDTKQCDRGFNKLLESSINLNQEVMARTLYCAALEHQYRYSEIRKQYTDLALVYKKLDAKKREGLLAKAQYNKNMGLSQFHGELIKEYLHSYRELTDSTYANDRDFTLNRASLVNHAGLGFFHLGKVKQAEKCFQKTHKLLKPIYRYLETPLNNLACTHIMLGKYKSAFKLLDTADLMLGKPKYQTYSIKMNKSIVLWKLNEVALSKNILKQILLDETVPDPIIHVTANVNLAYIYFCQSKFEEAAKLLKDSMKHDHRFLNDEYAKVQTLLLKYNLVKAGFLASSDIGDMSFVDLKESMQDPCRRPYRLDLNSLYVD